MKNKLKEMLLQHKPITEQDSDIDDIWGETVADGAENFEEIPEDGNPQEAPVEDEPVVDVPEEVENTEDEENSHTIADAIEESFLIPKSVKNWYYNDRVLANSKKLNKNIDKLEKAKKKWGTDPLGKPKIDKLEDKVSKYETKLDYHEGKNKESHDERYEKRAKKVLYKPGEIQKIIRDPRKLKVANPSLFAAQVENMAKADREITGRVAKATSENRDDAAVQAKQFQQAEEPKVAPKVAPKAMPTTGVAPTAPTTAPTGAQTYHQKVANTAAAVKERLSKVRSIM